jgi:acyl-CoA reductase-like NAD-dependent aldehyde dehydrogenase
MPESPTAARHEHQLLIGGKWVDAGGGTYDIVNPATEETVGQAPNATADDARAAAEAARDALPAWAALSTEERSALMREAAKAIRAKAPELLPLVIAETGATATVGSRMQVPVAADRFERYSRDPRAVLLTPLLPQAASATPLAPGGIIGGMVNRQPVGVVACVTSYNFPMVNMAGKVAPALAAGNTVVVKPAPQDPLAIVELVRILDTVGFPPGVVNLVNGSGPEAAAALVDSPDVDMVSFTGSTQVGTRIMEAAGKTMKRLLLELGGKGACVVFDDADLKAAITCIGSTWTFHSGQICTAPTRAVVHRSLFDQVRDGLAKMAGMLQVGDPTDKATIIGPVISAAQRDRIEAHVASAAADGGTVEVGGTRPALERGFYVAPTLITGDNNMRVAREEIFGPVITLIPFDDEDEGIAIANDSEFGLYDYVFSGDSSRALRAAKQLRAGHVGINTAQRNHEAPFGGFKMSGIGRDGGDFGLLAYSEIQSILWAG